MTILIKGMEMPEENHDYGGVKVWVDLRVYTDGSVSCRNLTGDFVDLGKCAVEVPTPHGRLIDINDVKNTKFAAEKINQYERWWNDALDSVIENAPTVIEAEG